MFVDITIRSSNLVANPLVEDLYLTVAQFLKVGLIFICSTIVGAYSIEQVRIITAKSLAYESTYMKGFARNLFHKDRSQYDEELAKYNSFDEFKESAYFQ